MEYLLQHTCTLLSRHNHQYHVQCKAHICTCKCIASYPGAWQPTECLGTRLVSVTELPVRCSNEGVSSLPAFVGASRYSKVSCRRMMQQSQLSNACIITNCSPMDYQTVHGHLPSLMEPSEQRRMLPALRSRWIQPLEWRHSSASSIW